MTFGQFRAQTAAVPDEAFLFVDDGVTRYELREISHVESSRFYLGTERRVATEARLILAAPTVELKGRALCENLSREIAALTAQLVEVERNLEEPAAV